MTKTTAGMIIATLHRNVNKLHHHLTDGLMLLAVKFATQVTNF